MKRWFSALCLLTASTVLWAADDKPSAKFQVISLAIYKAPPPKPGTFMMVSNGIHMELMVSLPDKPITGVDVKSSKLDSFRDDKDNVLFKKSGGLFGGGANWLQELGMRYGPDGESVTMQIRGTSPPGKGANKILLKGSLNIKCGADAKATDSKVMAMKPKEQADVGPFKVRVSQFGNQVEVEAEDENIKKIEFLDDKGKEIPISPSHRTRMESGKGKGHYVYYYFLGSKSEKFSVKIHYFAKVETVQVPLDLRVGLDLE